MVTRIAVAWGLLLCSVGENAAQTVPPPEMAAAPDGWRSARNEVGVVGEKPAAADSRIPSTFRPAAATLASGTLSAAPPVSAAAAAPAAGATAQPAGPTVMRRPLARVTEGPPTLPTDQGQVWREYDLSPYTLRVTTTSRPEQAVVDWILRETGYEVWHTEPLGVLSAGKNKLRVHHTPQMHNVVSEIVDRFVRSEAETRTFSARVVSVDQPNWRGRVQRMLRPVAAQSPGVQAWLLEREDAALLVAELRRRSDFREHSSPQMLVNNGQSAVVSTMRARQYTRDVVVRNAAWPGYEVQPGQVEEGFALEFNPLLSLDGRVIDAMLKCDIMQVERMVPVDLEVASGNAARQRAQVEVPQLSHSRFQERFRWPIDQVLLLDLGMVALPFPTEARSLIPGLPLSIGSPPTRADLLIFVESRAEAGQSGRTSAPGDREARKYHGRY